MARRTPEAPESPESILERVQTSFLESAIEEIPQWASGRGLQVRVQGRSRHFLVWEGHRIAMYEFRRYWLYCWLHGFDKADLKVLRESLNKPESIRAGLPSEGYVRFHVQSDKDLAVFHRLIKNRLR